MDFSRLPQFLSLPFAVQWRALLIRLPWLVPLPVLYFTSPGGPYPHILYLQSRSGAHKIPIYVFFPPETSKKHSSSEQRQSVPVHLDFHGGGFIMGSCIEQVPWCARLARETGRVVLSVDYRKGPLDQFPSALKDAEDVLAAVLRPETAEGRQLREFIRSTHVKDGQDILQLDPTRISISGFSSGGNIALNLVLSVPELDWPSLFSSPSHGQQKQKNLIPLVLFYPSFDSRLLPHERPWYGKPALKPAASMFTSFSTVLSPTYLPLDQRSHPRACPGLVSTSSINPYAEILLVLPEIDTLAAQSEEWVKKVREEGCLSEESLMVEKVEGMQHGWTQFPDYFLKEPERKEKERTLGIAAEFVRKVGGM